MTGSDEANAIEEVVNINNGTIKSTLGIIFNTKASMYTGKKAIPSQAMNLAFFSPVMIMLTS
ncbi:hypothetical protein LCAZH_2356 [Lacticaseibacillus paracasei]|nr:hypothetical protein LCAZH_2356 [Lacticaseibacillus paracasei]AGP69294.1 Hypothetical protein LOCK919_2616 [Lacticaseibacillus paracasei]EPC25820.1 hypothetical protein Lpp46_1916 [Lacticaseibacillus paracasei subsp. paracasei Lpp46]